MVQPKVTTRCALSACPARHGGSPWGASDALSGLPACHGNCPYGTLTATEARETNAVNAAARKVATVTLASTIGIFGSSQIAFAVDLDAAAAEHPAIEAPGQALADSPLSAGEGAGEGASAGASAGAGATGGTGSAGSASPSTPSEPDDDTPSASAADASESDDGHTVGTGHGDIGTVPMSSTEEVAELQAMAVAEASFADRVNEALAASSNAVITLSASETLDAQITIPAGKELTIDLNGCTLSCSGGTPFAIGGSGSALTIIDHSGAKSGVLNTGSGALTSYDGFYKAMLNLESGRIVCTSLCAGGGFLDCNLRGGSVSMSAVMVVNNGAGINIGGSCSVTSSAAAAFRIFDGSVRLSGAASITYTGTGAVFDMRGGSYAYLGSRNDGSGSGTITATNGSIVQFGTGKANVEFIGTKLSTPPSKPVFATTATKSGGKITYVSGVLPDDSVKNFLGADAFCVHEPSGGFVVHDQAFVNDNCVGVCNGVYYYSEADFAKATGDKVHFELVEFALDGAKQHIYVQPGTKLCDAHGFALKAAPAKDGYTFSWVRSSTGAKYTRDEVLNLPITASGQAYSFVGKYEANAVTPGPGPVDPDPPGPVDPDPPVPPGPVDPVDPDPPVPPGPGPVVPVNPGPDGPGAVIDAPADGVDAGGGANASRGLAPARPWMPAGLALAAGFTVPESGPGVVVLDELGQPVIAAAEVGAGGSDGDGDDDDVAGSLNEADDPEGGLIAFTVGDAVRVLAVASGVVVAALIAARVAAFMGANAGAARGRAARARGRRPRNT